MTAVFEKPPKTFSLSALYGTACSRAPVGLIFAQLTIDVVHNIILYMLSSIQIKVVLCVYTDVSWKKLSSLMPNLKYAPDLLMN